MPFVNITYNNNRIPHWVSLLRPQASPVPFAGLSWHQRDRLTLHSEPLVFAL